MIAHNEEDRLMLEEHHKSEHYGEILHMRYRNVNAHTM